MSKTYNASFQCPETGYPVEAEYVLGEVQIRCDDSFLNYCLDQENSKQEKKEFVDEYKKTQEWCKKNTGKRIKVLEDADSFLREISDGDCDGFDYD